jgi:uncharacterized tellurite resistance protein B-like protein
MKFTALSLEQRRALLDLALLAMYADGHLAAAEDHRVQLLIAALGHDTEATARREYDDAVGRVSRVAGSMIAATAAAKELAVKFTAAAERAEVLAVLDRLVESDRHISVTETDLLAIVREALGA